MVASPIETIRRGKRFADDAKALLDLIERRGVGGLIVGLPINMDGSEGPRCQSVRAFAENLLKLRDLPLAFWDERLSTAAVNRFLIGEADMSRKRRAEVVDKMAAAYILQGALDAMPHSPSPPPQRGRGLGCGAAPTDHALFLPGACAGLSPDFHRPRLEALERL
jgi:putative Holliday junction resolvase